MIGQHYIVLLLAKRSYIKSLMDNLPAFLTFCGFYFKEIHNKHAEKQSYSHWCEFLSRQNILPASFGTGQDSSLGMHDAPLKEWDQITSVGSSKTLKSPCVIDKKI